MKPRLIFLLLLLVVLPLGLLAGAGALFAREERGIREHRTREFLRGLLVEVDVSISRLLEEMRQELLAATQTDSLEPEALREIARESALIGAIFVIGREGKLIFPGAAFGLTDSEREFLERSRPVWQMGGPWGVPPAINVPGNSATDWSNYGDPTGPTQQAQQWHPYSNKFPADSGWHAWYWGNGTRVLFWQRQLSGLTVGAEVDRTRLMSRVIGVLPETRRDDNGGVDGRIVLRDANGEALYQWGNHEPARGAKPAASLGLSAPLHAWRLDYYVAPGLLTAGGKAFWFNVLAGLLGCGTLLFLLAAYFYRESSREMAEAAQRVNFVNQVSHELKTPLTNIRMYAELMEGRLGEEADTKTRQYLEVIAAESQRLSRLIGNVLTFGRSRRGTIALHGKKCEPDEVVKTVVEHFRPALERRKLKILMALNAKGDFMLDCDALEQMLGNLFSNVEKYGGEGGIVRITSRREGPAVVVIVADEGPGIPEEERERIFRPFYRINNSLSEGVSGTGIGLSIARELAHLHGGDLRLLDSEKEAQGAAFELRIRELESI